MMEWLRVQKDKKGFWSMATVTLLVCVCVVTEYLLFNTGTIKIFRYVLLIFGLSLIAWIDGHEHIIPNKILIGMFCIRSVLLFIECFTYAEYWSVFLTSSTVGFLMAGGMFLFCYMITRGAVGAGDVKLMAIVGYFIGSKFIFGTIFLIVLVAAIYNVIALLLKRVSLKQEVPFGPFVFVGTVLMIGLGL